MVQLQQLGAAALVIVVTAVMIGVGAVLMTQQATTSCTSYGDTWFNGRGNTTNASAKMLVNPLDSSWSGCCTTVNTSYPQGQQNGGYCLTWETRYQDINITYQGQTAMTTFGTWLPIIAVVTAAVVVIGLLVTYLGGGLRGRRM